MPLSDSYILIVEDEYMLARDLQIELEDAGAIVIGLAGSAESALDHIRKAVRIDVVVLDLNLGGEDAFVVANELAGRRIPFIIASGYDNQEVTLRYPNAVTFNKPYSVNRMINFIRLALVDKAENEK